MTVREIMLKITLLDKLAQKCFHGEDLTESEADTIARFLDQYRNTLLDATVSE